MRQPLGELLTSEARLTPEQLRLAEERQEARGGTLDTAVLELGLVSEPALVRLLAKAADLPVASPEMVTAPDAGLAAVLPQVLAEKHGIAPVAIERRQLSLLVQNPISLTVLDEIGFLLSRPLRAYVTTELRVQQRQAQVYRHYLNERFETLLRTHRTLEGLPESSGSSSTPTATPAPTATPVPTTTPAPAAALAPIAPVAQAPREDQPVTSWAEPLSMPATPPPEVVPESPSPPVRAALVAAVGRSSPLDALELVRAATTRDGILSAVLAYVRSAFEFVALYARRGPNMIVFEASGDGLQGADFAAAGLALDRPSVLRTVAEARAPYVGPVPTGDPFAHALGQMGRARLRAVLLYPVVMRDHTVLVVYGDSGGEALAPRQLSDVALVLSQVGAALERVILANKRRGLGQIVSAVQFVKREAPSPGPQVVAEEAAVPTSEVARVPMPPPATPLKKKRATLRWAAFETPAASPAGEPAPSPPLDGVASQAPAAPEPPRALSPAELPEAWAKGSQQDGAAVPETAPLVPEEDFSLVSPETEPPLPPELPPLLPTQEAVEPGAPPPLPEAATETAQLNDWVDRASSALDVASLEPLDPPLPRPVAARFESAGPDLLRPPPARQSLEFDLAIDWVDPTAAPEPSYSDLVRTFLAGKTDTRAAAERKLLAGGAGAAEALAQRFPGPLYVFRISFDELPEPRKLGPLIGLLGSMGEVALPALAGVADGSGEEKRFWATVLLAKMGHPACLPPLVRRIFDPAPDVAQAARRGLWSHRRQPEFARALEQIELELGSPDPTRAAQAARALGVLHHLPAVPRLIDLCGARQAEVAEAAAKALREITLQDFGQSERKWQAWWAQARQRPRAAWLVEALEHRDPELRLAAIGELAGATGQDFGYKSDLPAPQRALAIDRWKSWWQTEGRSGRVTV